ncbi:MAG: cobalt-precorrin-5B (C(1))-methyltransferase [Rhodospirillales bacterium]|nr:cobalt-precorrin-5B (C(1))-methyltransferase [Rhodospirillales bacterium]
MSDVKPSGPLRSGWTTGACATAATAAAYEALLSGHFPDPVVVALPRGGTVAFDLARAELSDGCAVAGVIKDAGDDPDVTHGAEVVVTLTRGATGSGIAFRAGEGVGTVTLPGLPITVGEPAINPGPRTMITQAIRAIADRYDDDGDVIATISIPGGAALAAKTLNSRLGIVGGLSILGNTGIVVPYSCASWIHSIHRGIDVARESGLRHLAAATGRTSEDAVRRLYGLPETALIDMGDFAGGMLKYLRKHPVPMLTIAGGFAKLTKLAQGDLYLHSSKSRVDINRLADLLASLGADSRSVAAARAANSGTAVLEIAAEQSLPLADAIARQARDVAERVVERRTAIEVIVFDRSGNAIGRAPFHD